MTDQTPKDSMKAWREEYLARQEGQRMSIAGQAASEHSNKTEIDRLNAEIAELKRQRSIIAEWWSRLKKPTLQFNRGDFVTLPREWFKEGWALLDGILSLHSNDTGETP